MARAVEAVPLRRRRATFRGTIAALLVLLLLLVIIAAISLLVGTEVIPVSEFLAALGSGAESASRTILFDLRLPRIALAAGVGGALASTGVLFQAMLRNPLAEPYILGISNGCAVGAILGYLVGAGPIGVTSMSFVGGAIVIAAVLLIGRGSFGLRSESMLLSGVMIDAVTAAIIFLLLHFMGEQVRTAVQWLMGDLGSAPAWVGYTSLGMMVLLLAGSLFAGRVLNALAMGDEDATALGVNVERTRLIAYLIASFVVGVTVSFCGAIGFVGLVVPHILRRIIGPDHRLLLPASVIGGGIFLIIADTLARSAMPMVRSGAGELPVGAVTALVGAPMFIWLLRRRG